jgi:hypothetical protein
MPKRIVDAYIKDKIAYSYRLDLGTVKTPFTEDECIGIAKQYHVEDGLSVTDVDKWLVRSPRQRGWPKKGG